MKVLLDISGKNADFEMKVLKSLTFVKKVTPMGNTAAILYDDLTESANQVRLHKQGKITLKTAQEVLNEL